MPLINFQRDGGAFPWSYGASGTLTSTLWLWSTVTLRYSLADPLATVPPDDTLLPSVLAHVVVDPATYEGTLGGGTPGATTFDALHQKWVICTYAGARKLFVIQQTHVDDLDAFFTQPAKTLPTIPPTVIPAPYGIDPKNIALLGQILATHIIDWQEE